MFRQIILPLCCVTLIAGCTTDSKNKVQALDYNTCQANAQGNRCFGTNTISSRVHPALSLQEKNALLSMRREEKLAHDVYVAIGKKFALRQFQHIPNSEMQHQRAMAALLANYGLEDPVASLGDGKFDQPEWQKLYDDFVDKGIRNESSAYAVGVEIEELDIADLQKSIAIASQPDIKNVMTSLEQASENHLRAFYRGLNVNAKSYSPRHLSENKFNSILGR